MPALGNARFWLVYDFLARVEERVELGLRDRGSVDDGDSVRRDGLVAASAGGRHQHSEGDEDGEGDAGGLHGERTLSWAWLEKD